MRNNEISHTIIPQLYFYKLPFFSPIVFVAKVAPIAGVVPVKTLARATWSLT